MDTNEPELSEEEFIQEGYRKNPFPFWFWLFIIVIVVTMLFGMQSLYYSYLNQSMRGTPFFQVTNREFSLFLWQHPELMRVNASSKANYLNGFNFMNQVNIEEGFAEKMVVAPPEVIFRYHAWNRLIKDEFTQRAIDQDEFMQFLDQVPEWKPVNWPKAPQAYVGLVNSLPLPNKDLRNLPESTLPMDVRIAFIGWKNFHKEGDQINSVDPTFKELDLFLQKYPHYDRSYWRNIVSLDYLKAYSEPTVILSGKVPQDQMAPFLKVAYYNYTMQGK